MAKVVLRNVYKKYAPSRGGVTAVSDFNLSIEDKEFLVLLGPSGCGKTTTLRMIAGLEDITAGEVYIGDKLVNDVQPKDRDIAMVFQNYALFPHLTVEKNVGYGLMVRGVAKAEMRARVAETLRLVSLEPFAKRHPAQLSGGQRQRLEIARSLVNDPALPKWKKMWETITSLNKKNDDVVILPGEELSAGNAKNQNVHYLIFNNKKF